MNPVWYDTSLTTNIFFFFQKVKWTCISIKYFLIKWGPLMHCWENPWKVWVTIFVGWAKDHHLMLALEMDDVQGPAEVIKGIPLNVATPLSSVKRCCNNETPMRFTCPTLSIIIFLGINEWTTVWLIHPNRNNSCPTRSLYFCHSSGNIGHHSGINWLLYRWWSKNLKHLANHQNKSPPETSEFSSELFNGWLSSNFVDCKFHRRCE